MRILFREESRYGREIPEQWEEVHEEVRGNGEVAVRLPLPLVEVWEELQPEVERLTGLAGLKIIQAVIEDEVMRRVSAQSPFNQSESLHLWVITMSRGRVANDSIPRDSVASSVGL
jgi:hypothetical protein